VATLAEVREAVADTLRDAGLRCEPWHQDSPSVPCVMIVPRSVTSQTFGQGVSTIELQLQVLSQRVSDRASQDEVDRLIATVRSAVLATPGLGRTDTSASLANVTDYGTVTTDVGVTYSSAVLDLTVVAKGA
jgi:hypothetical protein